MGSYHSRIITFEDQREVSQKFLCFPVISFHCFPFCFRKYGHNFFPHQILMSLWLPRMHTLIFYSHQQQCNSYFLDDLGFRLLYMLDQLSLKYHLKCGFVMKKGPLQTIIFNIYFEINFCPIKSLTLSGLMAFNFYTLFSHFPC